MNRINVNKSVNKINIDKSVNINMDKTAMDNPENRKAHLVQPGKVRSHFTPSQKKYKFFKQPILKCN